ncbi:zinc transporter ZIP4-like [Heteronotia binoei]|uniref:zinc transporter ZIP4-like n=1 Tax=Heteronotia binoei TaxID=13085 RepID=UPI00292E9113|nr:zinc transporter ZIP4-like [Heteronotia binoei]
MNKPLLQLQRAERCCAAHLCEDAHVPFIFGSDILAVILRQVARFLAGEAAPSRERQPARSARDSPAASTAGRCPTRALPSPASAPPARRRLCAKQPRRRLPAPSTAMRFLALLLVVVVRLARAGAHGGHHHREEGEAEAGRALAGLLASGEGALPPGAVETLLNIAAARVQCPDGPCGKCISAADIFALTEKKPPANTANLTSSELLPFSSGLAFYFSDPLGACQEVAEGRWVAAVRAFQTKFLGGNPAEGPTPEKVAELMATIQKKRHEPGVMVCAETSTCRYPERCREGEMPPQKSCAGVDQILENSTAISSRVASDPAGRVLATVAHHVLKGGCFRALPSERYFVDYIYWRYSNETHNLTLAS